MSHQPLVSAVIPTYNRPSLVLGAVKSALNQTHPNMEVIVVVDGPDNSTHRALGEIADPRIRIITLPQHQGACGARNAGVQAAKGEWVAFLDDDDEWLPAKTELQLSAAQSLHPPHPRGLVPNHCANAAWRLRLAKAVPRPGGTH